MAVMEPTSRNTNLCSYIL